MIDREEIDVSSCKFNAFSRIRHAYSDSQEDTVARRAAQIHLQVCRDCQEDAEKAFQEYLTNPGIFGMPAGAKDLGEFFQLASEYDAKNDSERQGYETSLIRFISSNPKAARCLLRYLRSTTNLVLFLGVGQEVLALKVIDILKCTLIDMKLAVGEKAVEDLFTFGLKEPFDEILNKFSVLEERLRDQSNK